MVEKLHRVERGKSEGLNKYDLFFNRKAARVLLLMFRPMTIKKISRKSYGIHLSYLEHKEPKKLLLKIWREKKGGKGEEYKYKMEREILERILKKRMKKSINKLDNESTINFMTEKEASEVINEMNKIIDKRVDKEIKRKKAKATKQLFGESTNVKIPEEILQKIKIFRRETDFRTSPTAYKYCKTFEKLKWIKKVEYTDYVKRADKWNISLCRYKKNGLIMNLPQIIFDYLTTVKNIPLNKKEKKILFLIFSLQPFSDQLIEICTIYDKDVFPFFDTTIAIFVEKLLFRFLSYATSVKVIDDEIKIVKKILELFKKEKSKRYIIQKIEKEINSLGLLSICFIILKMMAYYSPHLIEKILNQALPTHLKEYIETNLRKNQNIYFGIFF